MSRTAKRVVELPYVGVVLLVFDDGVETVSTVTEVGFDEVVRAHERAATLALFQKVVTQNA